LLGAAFSAVRAAEAKSNTAAHANGRSFFKNMSESPAELDIEHRERRLLNLTQSRKSFIKQLNGRRPLPERIENKTVS
jgi:hypothetical protein